MDSIRVAKVEGVACRKPGHAAQGTLHLTAHHLIFKYDFDAEEELWVPYPLISLVTRLPQTLQGLSPLSVQCRTFRFFTLSFRKDTEATDVFDSIRELTVTSSVTQLYAFFYVPNPPFPTSNGWSIYSPREEFARMGIGSRTKAWRFTDINKDYSFCPTYPARLAVPTRISDTTLQYASKYRSKCRIPALVYLHWANFGTITRSSQPMVGLTNNRSIQDEKLIEAIFQSHHSPESRSGGPVYGATSTNLIIDARPTTNAMANVAKGAGTENMDHYKEGKKAYLGVDNIHVMRDSLNKVVDAVREADALAATIGSDLGNPEFDAPLLDRQALRKSGWLRHISAILGGTLLIIRNIHINSSHVLVHCSDGWDRTAQLSSLAELCLDPYYRTIKGFRILIEKDWLSFGHKFLDRCGHLSSDKFFISPAEGAGGDAAQAFLASVQSRLAGQGHLKETSPVFHQFLECVRQIQRQFPERFEFNSRFLEQLHYHLYSCQFGTFLFNCERDRRVGEGGPPPCDRTISIWDFLDSPSEAEKNLNPEYDPSLDDPKRRDPKADMGVLFPNPKDVRFWYELYGKTDEEMNGRPVTAQAEGAEVVGLVDSADDDPVSSLDTSTAVLVPLPASPAPSPVPPIRPLSSASQDNAVSSQSNLTLPSSPGASSSMPNLRQKPIASRQDSFRAIDSSTSAFSLQPQRPPVEPISNPSAESPSPGRTRSIPIGVDIFGSGGMKSMWGKLSTNASAAFTAVQGAYDGVSKELKGLASPEGEGGVRSAELGTANWRGVPAEESDWTSLPSAGSQPTASFSSRADSVRDSWRGVGPVSPPSIVLDNPWGTVRAEQRPKPREDSIFATSSAWADTTSSSGLPSDPNVAHIAQPVPTLPRNTTSPFATMSRKLSNSVEANAQSLSVGAPTHPDNPATTSASSSNPADPLGVGFL
ncbi:phosphatases II [Rickenella mellea]|uniref:Phosphatases II n=1 Tax=Rickenella mellea TaxID=50990 RepID=A0A4Y7QDT0_9AGAM|nr:phosphatases II [Rickenella mellea]